MRDGVPVFFVLTSTPLPSREGTMSRTQGQGKSLRRPALQVYHLPILRINDVGLAGKLRSFGEAGIESSDQVLYVF